MSSDPESNSRKTDSLENQFSSSPILWKLLIPLVVVAFFLVFSFVTITWWEQNAHLDQHIHDTTRHVENYYLQSLDFQSARLLSEMEWLLDKPAIIEGLEQHDYNLLLNASSDPYLHFSKTHGITHFYFEGPDRVNILRVHKPELNGDTIDRFTTLEAERTGEVASGIELGSMGTFTLRTVVPVYSNGSLIGYMELGTEIGDILDKVALDSGAELIVFIDKYLLDRGRWETGMTLLGRNGNWDKYQSKVMIYSTPSAPASFELLSDVESRLKAGEIIEIEGNGSIWQLSSIPLNDVSGEEVGFIVIMQDITGEKADLSRDMKMIIAVSLLVFSLLFLFYYSILTKTDRLIVENELALKESSSKFRYVIDAAHDAIVVADQKGNVVHWNKSAESIFGYAQNEMLNKDISLLIPERYREEHKAKFCGSGVKGRIVELEALRKDGSKIPVELSLSSWGSNGNRYYAAVIRDISKRKEDEEALKQYAIDLERSNELKSIFTDIMRHDLLNPINFINGYLNVLFEKEEDSEIRSMLQSLLDATSKLITMIEEASKFSKLKTSQTLDDLQDMDLNLLLTSSIIYIREQADAKGMSIDFNFSSPRFVKADPMVEDVFTNILSNAIKYSPENTKVIVDVSDAEEFWKISVIDSGEGVSDEDKPIVFDRFKRVTKGHMKGTGLGLAIVKRIVELHGGDVGVEDNPAGQGSVFWVTLKKGSPK